MRPELLAWLRCPACRSGYEAVAARSGAGGIEEGQLRCGCAPAVPVRGGIPRFAGSDGYARSFSFEWQRHATTQLDSASGTGRSAAQFAARLDVPLEWLRGKLVLDAGCGSGRFAEVAVRYGATVIGADLSAAVDEAARNLRQHSRAHWLQADLARLPFAPETFDLIYSFGVLHHTPRAREAFEALVPLLKPGGRLSVFVYSSYNKGIVYSSKAWRALTTRLPRRLLYGLCAASVPLYFLYRLPLLGPLGKMLLPISMEPDWRWRWLDTFDWYSPRYQSKHTHAEVCAWMQRKGLEMVFIGDGEVTMVGRKPQGDVALAEMR
jgi:SAM-dependent methyltransferase